MTDSERLLDNLLNDVAAGRRTPAECLSLCQHSDPDLVPSLEFALALSDWEPDESDMTAAQENVWRTVAAGLDDDVRCGETQPEPYRGEHVLSLPARPHYHQFRGWLPLAVYAATLALVLMGSWILTGASADALPGSPLYGVKRADEDFQLRVAWSSQMRSQALAQIALRRLDEARAEAARGNDLQAVTLMNESNDATRQLIDLAIALQRDQQDNAVVQGALATTLQAEYDALIQANRDGQSALAESLSANVNTQQHALSTSNISISPSATPASNAPPGAAHPSQPSHPTPAARPTPPTHPTPSGQGTPGSGNGNGNNGNGNGHGKGGHS